MTELEKRRLIKEAIELLEGAGILLASIFSEAEDVDVDVGKKEKKAA